jgi:hypothetical protein
MLLVALVLGAAACTFIPSAYRLDLYQTQWRITAVDGDRVVGEPTLLFNEGGADGQATLETVCGATLLGFDHDSDGDGAEFWFKETISSIPCDEASAAAQNVVLQALLGIDSWTVHDDNAIEMASEERGGSAISLEWLPAE